MACNRRRKSSSAARRRVCVCGVTRRKAIVVGAHALAVCGERIFAPGEGALIGEELGELALLRDRSEVGLHERGTRIRRKQNACRVVSKHDLAVEELGVLRDEVGERRAGRSIHEVPSREHPRAGDRYMELGARDAVVFDKAQKRFAHALNGRFNVVLHEIGVRKPYMRFVVELRWRDRVSLECRSKRAIFLGGLVRSHAPSLVPRAPTCAPIERSYKTRVGAVTRVVSKNANSYARTCQSSFWANLRSTGGDRERILAPRRADMESFHGSRPRLQELRARCPGVRDLLSWLRANARTKMSSTRRRSRVGVVPCAAISSLGRFEKEFGR